jgi:MarR family transcriptional regulator, temperature-dependent positive regulator of motility
MALAKRNELNMLIKTRNVRPDLSVMHLLHRGGQHADEMFSLSIENSDITPRQYEVLSAVAKKDGASQTDIVNATGIDRSTTSSLVERLVKKGWLQRRRSKDDIRAYAVRLTAAGKKAMKIGENACLEADEKVLATLSSAQRAKLIKALGTIVQELDSPD